MQKILVVVDMQNDFIDGALGTKEAVAIVPKVAEKIRTFDGEVIFTRDTHEENYMETQEGRKLPVPHCIKDTDGWQIVPEIEDACKKKTSGAFRIIDKPSFGSIELGEELKRISEASNDKLQIDFCGVCTGICVISNVAIAKAECPEAAIRVIKDACACVTPQSHETAIAAMQNFQVDVIL